MTRRSKISFLLKLTFILMVLMAAGTFPLGSMAGWNSGPETKPTRVWFAMSPADSLTTDLTKQRPGILVGPAVVQDSTWMGRYWSEPGFSVVHRPRRSRKESAPASVARMSLDVKPTNAELFIDGRSAGSARGRNREIWLEPGSHLVMLRHSGYQTLSFDIQVAAGQSYDLHRELERGA